MYNITHTHTHHAHNSVFAAAIFFSIFFLLSANAVSAIPQLISVHGKLTDTLNNPYSGSKNFVLRIYSAQSGGSALYTEFWNTTTQQVTLATGGYFSVMLGSYTTLTLPFDQQYWLELSIEGETLSPRYKLGSTPYTYHANITENLAANANASGNLNMNAFNILNAGLVGVGLSSPLSLLHLYQSGSNTVFNASNGTVNAGLFVGTLSGGNAGASIGTNSNNQFRIFTNGTDALTVDTNGNVGIGTTSPVVKLQAGTDPNYIGLEPRTDGMFIGGIMAANAARVGGLYSTNPIPGAAIHFGAQGASGQRGVIAFLTKATDDNTNQPSAQMVITQTGNVGIGTTNPSGTFHANGIIYFTSEGTTASAANVYTDPTTGQVLRSTSSARYKDNIRNLEVDSSLIYKLVPRTFESKSDGKTYFGLVAEEVNQHIPQLVQYDSQGRPDSVAYPMLSTLMLPEMKKMSDAVKELDAKNLEQQKEIELLKSRVAALERG